MLGRASPTSGKLVYEALISRAGASRAAIARVTGLSLPTVSSVVDSLIEDGLVREIGPGDSTGGRKPVLLEVVPDSRFVVAVDLGATNLRCGLVDQTGHVVDESLGCPINPELRQRIADEIAGMVESMVRFRGCRERVLAVGIATPGVTDPETGRFHLAPVLGANEISIREPVASRLGLATFVENEANAAALGEITFGDAKGADPFVFVSTGTGIGAGVIVRNSILRGYGSAAGEVGYLVVDRHWTPQARYGFGCFESLASETAIVQRTTRKILDGYPSRIGSRKASRALSFTDVVEAIREGDLLARQVLEEVVEYFAIGLANIVAVVSPELITVGGALSTIGDDFLLPVKDRLSRLVPYPPRLSISRSGSDANLVGAAAVAIKGVAGGLLHGATRCITRAC